jgi:hypothetical protein
MKYGIVGSGEATASVVHAGLSDLLSKDKNAEFLIHARKSPQGAVGDVYDYLIDNEVSFRAYTRIDDKAPKLLLDSALDVVKTDDPLKSILNDAETILILWDEESPENSEKVCLMADAEGIAVLDLSMALTPIVIESSDEDPKEEPSPKTVPQVEEDDDEAEFTPFSRAELESMTIGVLRRQAKALGIDGSFTTKEALVNAITAINGGGEVASDVHVPKNEQAVVIWYQDGQPMTVHVDLEKLKPLLN